MHCAMKCTDRTYTKLQCVELETEGVSASNNKAAVTSNGCLIVSHTDPIAAVCCPLLLSAYTGYTALRSALLIVSPSVRAD